MAKKTKSDLDPIQVELQNDFGYSARKKSKPKPMAEKPDHLIRGIAFNPKNSLAVRETYMTEIRRRSAEGITVP